MIRKFFDPAVAEPTSAAPLNIAALMAQHGVKNDSDNPVATPIEIKTEVEEETKAEEATPVETTTEPSISAEVKSETPQQLETPRVDTPLIEEQPKEPTLQEVLRKHQPEAILKELGYDEKVVDVIRELKQYDPKVAGLVQSYKEGKLSDYVKELSVDYSKMAAEEVMRHQLRTEYPKASKAQLDILYEEEVLDRYKLDPEKYSEGEVSRGKLLLEAKADNYRDKFVANQEKFLLPKPPEPIANETDNSDALAARIFEGYQSKINSSQLTKKLLSENKLLVGEGEDAFSYPLQNAKGLVDNIVNVFDAYSKVGALSEDSLKDYSEENMANQILIAAISENPKEFLKQYAQHFKSIGGKSAIAPIDNAKDETPVTQLPTQAAPKNAAEAMARGGQLNSGGYSR